MNTAERIKTAVTMPDIYEKYGFEPNRAGFIVCPFHREDTPSLGMYRSGTTWHCFGCGAGGSVIDFVMRLFSLSFRQAVVRIDNDFGLRLIPGKPDARKTVEIVKERRIQEQEAKRRQEQLDKLWKRYAIIDRFLSTHLPEEESGGDFGALLGELDRLWWRIEEMTQKGR